MRFGFLEYNLFKEKKETDKLFHLEISLSYLRTGPRYCKPIK